MPNCFRVVDSSGQKIFVQTPCDDSTDQFISLSKDEYFFLTAGAKDSLLALTPSQGVEIAGAILAVWALGYGIRLLIRVLNSDGDSLNSERE